MSVIVTPYSDHRRQPNVWVVWGIKGRLHAIARDDPFREEIVGEPDAILRMIAAPDVYYREKRQEWAKGKCLVVSIIPLRNLALASDARNWRAEKSRDNKYTRIRHKQLDLSIGYIKAKTPQEVFDFIDLCESHGVRFSGSPQGAAVSLFRTTLTKPFRLWFPPDYHELLLPGRHEVFQSPAQFYDMAYYDLIWAYPQALAASPIPTGWRQIDPRDWRQYPDGVSKGSAYVPKTTPRPRPLAFRLKDFDDPDPSRVLGARQKMRVTYGTGAFRGTWTHLDMLAAEQCEGVSVKTPDETWVPDNYTDVFSSDGWYALQQELRASGKIGKMAVTMLWAMFAFDTVGTRYVEWTDPDANEALTIVTPKAGLRHEHGYGVSVAATSRVRRALWEGIQTAGGAVYCNTDGFIAPASASSKLDSRWGIKERYDLIDIALPGVYRWMNKGDIDFHYLGDCEKHFRSKKWRQEGLDIGSDDGTEASISMRQAYIRRLLHDENNRTAEWASSYVAS